MLILNIKICVMTDHVIVQRYNLNCQKGDTAGNISMEKDVGNIRVILSDIKR